MKLDKQHSRRHFLRNTTLASAGFFIVPRHVLGKGYIAPSDKLNIAAIGAGGKAEVNLANSWNNGSDNIVALCDVDDRQAANSRKKYAKATYYRDFRVMLEKENKNIDAVIVSPPDHTHAVAVVAAMQLGKHIYCEKPLTHDIYEARILTQAAEKYKVVTQMGNQGSSGDDTRLIETWVQEGVIGDVHTVHVWTNRPTWPQGIPTPTGKFAVPKEVDWDLWLGTAPYRDFNPTYLPAIWRGWSDFGTGSLGDMGCHFIDVPYRALQLKYPVAVETSVGSVYSGFFKEEIYNDSYPPSSKTHIQFPARGSMPPVEMIWYDGGIKPKRPEELLPDEPMGEWDGGIIFEGTKGKLMAGLFGRNATLLPTKLMKETTLPASKYPFVEGGSDGHQQQWVKACKKGFGTYTSSSFDKSGPLTETVLMGNLAVRSYNYQEKNSKGEIHYPGRKKLLWDGENMRITNFEPANQFVKRAYRGSWKLEL
ncbi:Gfo/Idh/MocA family protein [Foetidibacter luteolus]|uniref:Gfo/Idh/MocA family protein n=1 Tax=Foetidibacter luteolus TaxID=2608880 RepID=UPI00129AD535|nr:Gfo/Idh/MocA family oxidoreductase [Foetidibacter luteolus]